MDLIQIPPIPSLLTLEDAFIAEFPQHKLLFGTMYYHVYRRKYARDQQTLWADLVEAVGRRIASEIVIGYEREWRDLCSLYENDPVPHYKITRAKDRVKASQLIQQALDRFTSACIQYRNELEEWRHFHVEVE
jgi:hypothetical protein